MDQGWDVADLWDPIEGVEISETAMRLMQAKEGELWHVLWPAAGQEWRR